MARAKTYRHTRTGTTRVSDRHLGFPWELQTSGGGSSSSTKEQLIAEAAALGLSTDGTKADIAARIAEAAATS